MRSLVVRRGIHGATLAVAAICAAGASAADPVGFNRDVRPILADVCWKCHGQGKQQAGLRLDRRESALAETESGSVPIVPGQPEQSELVRRIFSTDPDETMPPPNSHKTLTAEQQEILRRWVAEGAAYEGHWSFQTPRKPPVPVVLGTDYRIYNPIDSFIAERLRHEGLAMSAEADRPTLIRRVAFALTGLAPTPAEVDAYLADAAPQAYEQMVERYLASPHFGEEMARHWLDVARYADTHGLHLDNERQTWAYRDWVIAAFNRNLPFDQFTIDQLAGDLVPGGSLDQLVATGFIRCNVTTGEGGSIDAEWVFRNAVDRAATTAQAWLGLTAGCCVCHDHKFDPITQQDFYSLYAFFHSAADPPLDGNVLLTQPTAKLMTAEVQAKLSEMDAQIGAAQSRLDALAASVAYTDPATLNPPPAPTPVENAWFDDEFPVGGQVRGSPGHPTTFVTAADGQVLSGQKALKRSDAGLAQDVYEGTTPLEIPPQGRLFAYVWIDPASPPKELMLQYNKGGWLHRAVWGDYDAIDWGRRDTTERVLIGPLPQAGGWARLEVEAARVGLQAGDVVTGFALTQFGGTVYWDKAGVAGQHDSPSDPRRSYQAWRRAQVGKDTPGVPAELAAALKAGPDQAATAEIEDRLRRYYLAQVCLETRPALEPMHQEIAALVKGRADAEANVPGTFVFRDLPQPRESFVMLRGQYNKPGEPVEPRVPAALPPLALADGPRRATRLDLARWLVSPEQPLTARVTVNRFWQQFLGTGLVKTSFDFGTQGEPPSHPELLDWLAVWYREAGWNTKDLVRLLVTSATFRQSSAAGADLWQRDPQNRLYARGPRFRLDAEQIRDNALFTSGLLNPAMGGRGVQPYQPPNVWEPVGFVGSNTANYQQDHGPALYRRSIYTFFKRTAPPPFLANFDAPNREMFCTRRERSNTPLQALQLMNDVQHFEAARALAERLIGGGPSPAQRIALGYRIVLARQPEPEELAIATGLLDRQLAKYRANPAEAAKAIRNGESPPAAGMDEAELAAYTLVANLLLNLDETLNRN